MGTTMQGFFEIVPEKNPCASWAYFIIPIGIILTFMASRNKE